MASATTGDVISADTVWKLSATGRRLSCGTTARLPDYLISSVVSPALIPTNPNEPDLLAGGELGWDSTTNFCLTVHERYETSEIAKAFVIRTPRVNEHHRCCRQAARFDYGALAERWIS